MPLLHSNLYSKLMSGYMKEVVSLVEDTLNNRLKDVRAFLFLSW
jgi:hypothetical protein